MKVMDLSIGEEVYISEFHPTILYEVSEDAMYEEIALAKLDLLLESALEKEPSRKYYHKIHTQYYDETKVMYVWAISLLFDRNHLPPWVDVLDEDRYISGDINDIILAKSQSILQKAIQAQAQQYNQNMYNQYNQYGSMNGGMNGIR